MHSFTRVAGTRTTVNLSFSSHFRPLRSRSVLSLRAHPCSAPAYATCSTEAGAAEDAPAQQTDMSITRTALEATDSFPNHASAVMLGFGALLLQSMAMPAVAEAASHLEPANALSIPTW